MLELRFLLERGYRRPHALGFVSERHQLAVADRNVLERVIFASGEGMERAQRLVGLDVLQGAEVVVDGYNVVIGVECVLAGRPTFLCDDGLVRDVAAVRGRHAPSPETREAVRRICHLLGEHRAASATFLFDAQVSRSGELCGICRQELGRAGLRGEAETDRHVDRRLKAAGESAVICSSDRAVVDAARRVFDVVAALVTADGAIASPPSALRSWALQR
jgi:hypothetical protein